MKTNKINIALCADKNYLEPLETLLKSISYSNSQVKIYLLHTDISVDWLERLAKTLQIFENQLIPICLRNANLSIRSFSKTFIPNTLPIDILLKDLPNTLGYVNELTYARFLIPELINEDRVLYLDTDIIVNTNLSSFFHQNMKDFPIAAIADYDLSNENVPHWYVLDIPEGMESFLSYKGGENFKPYFNAGVILWDIVKCRNENITHKLLQTALYYNAVIYGDQDILNFVFFKRWLMLDIRYNVQAHYNFTFLPLVTESPWIIHYITDRKPWIPEYKDETIFHPVYHYYKNLTWQSIQEYCSSKN